MLSLLDNCHEILLSDDSFLRKASGRYFVGLDFVIGIVIFCIY